MKKEKLDLDKIKLGQANFYAIIYFAISTLALTVRVKHPFVISCPVVIITQRKDNMIISCVLWVLRRRFLHVLGAVWRIVSSISGRGNSRKI